MRTVILALLTLTALSGCFGYPDDAVVAGDTVVVVFDGADVFSGEQLMTMQQAGPFVMGRGTSGLGGSVERALIGQPLETEVDAIVEPQPDSTTWRFLRNYPAGGAEPTVPLAVGEQDLQVPRQVFAVGQEFTYRGPNGLHKVIITEVTNETVSYRFNFRDDRDGYQVDAIPAFGVRLLARVNGNAVEQLLEPIEGAVLALQSANPFYLNDVDDTVLPPGFYRMTGVEGDMITAERADTLAGVLEHPMKIKASVVAVTARPPTDIGGNPLPTGEHFGVRPAPQIGS